MNPYQNGKIYIIDCPPCLPYIGSTIMSLERRMSIHKCIANDTRSKFLFQVGIPIITLLENFKCNNKRELEQKEQYWIDKIDCINQVRAFRSDEERLEYQKQHYEQNRTKRLEYQKQYNEQNRTEIVEYNKQRYEQNKTEILEQQKQYREQNRTKMLEKMKQRYEQNKTKILEQKKQPTTCDICGSVISKNNISTHKKSTKCINFQK